MAGHIETDITSEEARLQLIELSAQNSNDFQRYSQYFYKATESDIQYTYLEWLKDDRYNWHVKLAIYIRLFNGRNYYTAQCELDHAQTDRDMCDYLCNHLDGNSYVPYRDMLNNFLELMDKLMMFDYPTNTCEKILDIAQNPVQYNKYQVCCALDVLNHSHYRFPITWSNDGEFYKKMAGIWEDIVLKTNDEDICTEGIYYVLSKGNLDDTKYGDLVEKLWDKHPHDKVTLELYRRYLKPTLMLSASDRLQKLKESDASLAAEALRDFSEAASSSQFLNSVGFDVNNELIRFCISDGDSLNSFVRGMDEECYNDSYFKSIDILLSIYTNIESCTKVKLICLKVMDKIIREHNYSKNKKTLDANLDIIDTYIDKIIHTYTSNSQNHIIKLRCAQALALLFRNMHQRTKKKLKDAIVFILSHEGRVSEGNEAVKQIVLYVYLAIQKTPIRFPELQDLTEKVKELQALNESYLIILYHALDSLKCTEDELNYLFSSVVQHNNDSIKNQALSKLLHDKLADYCKRKHFKNIDVLQNEPDIELDESRLGTDQVFLKNRKPFEGISPEIVLCLIPKLNQIDPVEWKDNIDDEIYWTGVSSKHKSMTDDFRTSVDEFLSNQSST